MSILPLNGDEPMESTPAYDALVAERAEHLAQALHEAHPEFDEIPVLEDDETVPPRPEEEIADAARDLPEED